MWPSYGNDSALLLFFPTVESSSKSAFRSLMCLCVFMMKGVFFRLISNYCVFKNIFDSLYEKWGESSQHVVIFEVRTRMVCVSWDEKGRITVCRILGGRGWKCVLRCAVYFPDLRMLVGSPSKEFSSSEFLFIM